MRSISGWWLFFAGIMKFFWLGAAIWDLRCIWFLGFIDVDFLLEDQLVWWHTIIIIKVNNWHYNLINKCYNYLLFWLNVWLIGIFDIFMELLILSLSWSLRRPHVFTFQVNHIEWIDVLFEQLTILDLEYWRLIVKTLFLFWPVSNKCLILPISILCITSWHQSYRCWFDDNSWSSNDTS